MTLRSVERSLVAAVAETVEALDLSPADAATVALARAYASSIDALTEEQRPKLIGQVGPSLLRCLQQLGASPMARAEIGKRVHGRGAESELSRLRALRRPG